MPRLELSVTQSEYRQEGRGGRGGREGRPRPSKREEELSAEFLPVHNTASLRPVLSDQTQSELVLSVPTMDDDTKDLPEDDTFDMERSTDFVRANMKMASKRSGQSGRISGAGSVESVRHKAGSVPRYLRTRKAEWAEANAEISLGVPGPRPESVL